MNVISVKSTQDDVRTHLFKLQDRKIPHGGNCRLELQVSFTPVIFLTIHNA